MVNDLYLAHLEALSQYGLSQSSLPKELNEKIIKLILKADEYSQKPDEKEKINIEHESAKLANEIMDYAEENLEEPPTEQTPSPAAAYGESTAVPQQPTTGEDSKSNNSSKEKGGMGIFDWLF